MKHWIRWCVVVLGLLAAGTALRAQGYTGITGLVHIPTAEMAKEGDVRAGGYFLSHAFLPDDMKIDEEIGSYNTFGYYLAITPFSWMELSYICVHFKTHRNADPNEPIGYYMKDRHFNLKLRPLKEGRYWPAIAIGLQDPSRLGKESNGINSFFQNAYGVASKHFNLGGHELSAHVAYRYYWSVNSRDLRGVAGGVAYRPAFARNLRLSGEYTGDAFIVGADCLLWKHLSLQASLQDGKHFVGGISLQMNLF